MKGDIANMSEQQQEMQFKADTLSLHTDCMKICRHFAEVKTNLKSRQIAQATWVRTQVHQGRCQVIEPYMQNHCLVKGGESVGALMDSWSKFVGDASAASALTGSVVKIVFSDCHKFARMSDDDLNALFDMMVRVSDADPKNFAGLVIVTTAAMDDSVFSSSWLVRRRATVKEAQWLSPSEWVVPSIQPGSATSPSTMSLEKRAIHLLAGESVPQVLLDSLLLTSDGTPKPILSKRSDAVIVLNFTPYEAGLELACMRANLKGPCTWKSCSLSLDVAAAKVCESRVARQLILDWKTAAFQLMPAPQFVFKAELPEHEAQRFHDPGTPELALMKFDSDGRALIPSDVRRKWANDPCYGPEWLEALKKGQQAQVELSDSWSAKKKEDLANIQHTCSSEIPDVCLHLVHHETDGYQLFVEAAKAMTLPKDKVLFRTGPADWFKPPKSTRLLANESEKVQVELPNAGLTEASSIRDVLHEAESGGVCDLQLWAHTLSRPHGAAQIPGEIDHFVIAPATEAEGTWVYKPKNVEVVNVRASNLGNFLPQKMVTESPRLATIWVVNIDEAMATMVPKRPQFFLKEKIPLQQGEVIRVA
eukprot:s1331_g22.t1